MQIAVGNMALFWVVLMQMIWFTDLKQSLIERWRYGSRLIYVESQLVSHHHNTSLGISRAWLFVALSINVIIKYWTIWPAVFELTMVGYCAKVQLSESVYRCRELETGYNYRM